MSLSPRVVDAILSLLSDSVSDDETRANRTTALIDESGKIFVATDGCVLVKVTTSSPVTTALIGDRIDPKSARKLIKAGKHPERKQVDSKFPDFLRVIPAKVAITKDSDGRYDANTAPSCDFDAVLLARVLSGVAKVGKACGKKLAGITFQTSTDLNPARIDATFCDGGETVDIVAVVMPMRL